MVDGSKPVSQEAAVHSVGSELSAPSMIRVFMAFAAVYLLSTLVRAVTATLAPVLQSDFSLSAGQLGLLAGSYFVGFCLMQLPLGYLLDRFGPPRVARAFLLVAIVGCGVFATSTDFTSLFIGRMLLGLGLAAGLMAPMTAYRRWYATNFQLRASSWMLMMGSLGMLISTLPVQWLLPVVSWRGIFAIWAGLAALAFVGLWLWLPQWHVPDQNDSNVKEIKKRNDDSEEKLKKTGADGFSQGFGTVFCNRRLLAVAPIGFFCYGGMFAILTLWVGPWMQYVMKLSPSQAAAGLFWINAVMLLVYLGWGFVGPTLARSAGGFERLVAWLAAPGLLVLPFVVGIGTAAAWPWWALYCAAVSGLSLLQPKLAQTFPKELAGRALTAFNLVSFTGTFCVQWGLGLGVDWFIQSGWSTKAAYQGALGVFWICNLVAFGWFLLVKQKT